MVAAESWLAKMEAGGDLLLLLLLMLLMFCIVQLLMPTACSNLEASTRHVRSVVRPGGCCGCRSNRELDKRSRCQ